MREKKRHHPSGWIPFSSESFHVKSNLLHWVNVNLSSGMSGNYCLYRRKLTVCPSGQLTVFCCQLFRHVNTCTQVENITLCLPQITLNVFIISNDPKHVCSPTLYRIFSVYVQRKRTSVCADVWRCYRALQPQNFGINWSSFGVSVSLSLTGWTVSLPGSKEGRKIVFISWRIKWLEEGKRSKGKQVHLSDDLH